MRKMIRAFSRRQAAALLCLCTWTLGAHAGPKLYVFDCGILNLDNVQMFNLSEDETDVRTLFVPCYVVEHEQGRLLWDAGLPLSYAEADGLVPTVGGTVGYERSIVAQLGDLGLTPADIDYAAFSHLHWDHAGAANAFAGSTILMQQAEWDAAFSGAGAFVETEFFDELVDSEKQMLDGDHDVFGDGSVKIIFAPGHTPGHQVLWVDLENYGPVLLSGDLYHFEANRRLRRPPNFNFDKPMTLKAMDRVESVLADTGATLWIEHSKALADTLEMAPAFYD